MGSRLQNFQDASEPSKGIRDVLNHVARDGEIEAIRGTDHFCEGAASCPDMMNVRDAGYPIRKMCVLRLQAGCVRVIDELNDASCRIDDRIVQRPNLDPSLIATGYASRELRIAADGFVFQRKPPAIFIVRPEATRHRRSLGRSNATCYPQERIL